MTKNPVGFRRYRHAPRPQGFAATQNALAGYVMLGAQQLVDARRALRLSQADLAALLGVPTQDIARIESGRLYITEPYAKRLSEKLGGAQLVVGRVMLVPAHVVTPLLTMPTRAFA
jgi:DNA-binding XRE family transcriptional regulator